MLVSIVRRPERLGTLVGPVIGGFALVAVLAAAIAARPGSARAADALWRVVPSTAPGGDHAAAAMDTRRRVLLAYGGQLGKRAGHGLFSLDPATESWSELPLGGETPPALSAAAAVYDSTSDRLLLVGSDADAPSMPLGCWAIELQGRPYLHRLVATGEAPSARHAHVAMYDPDQQRILVHGGYLELGLSADLHQLSLEPEPVWTRLEAGGYVPPAKADHAGVYDPEDSSFVIWGGEESLTSASSVEGAGVASSNAPAYRLRFNKYGPLWELLDLPGPSRSIGVRAVLDRAHRAMVVTGTYTPGCWALVLGETPAWTSRPAAPWVGGGPAIGADPATDLLVVHARGGTWTASLGSPDSAWHPVAASARGPIGLAMHVGFFDPVESRLLLFGGWGGGAKNDVWSFTVDSGWKLANPVAGTPPAARYFPAWAYVPSRDAMWMFGGQSQQALFADCYELPLRAGTGWRNIPACGQAPAARSGAALAYSPASQSLLLFGGTTDILLSRTPDSAAYVLQPGSGNPCWTRVTSPGPSGRFLHTLVFDSRRNRALCFGGVGGDDRCWAFDFASRTWSVVVPDGPGPGRHWKHVAAYDEQGDRMLVYGGDGSVTCSELWALEFSPFVHWRKLETNGDVGTLVEGAGGFDPAGSLLFTQGGDYPGFYECRLVRPAELAVEAPGARAVSVRVLRNPSPGAWALEVAVTPGAPVRAELFDIAGRRLESVERRAGSDGRATIPLGAGRALRPGLYFARVVTSQVRTSVRLARTN